MRFSHTLVLYAANLLGSAGNIYCDATSYARFARLHLSSLLACRNSSSTSDADDVPAIQYLGCETFNILHTPHSAYSNTLYTAGGWYYSEQSSLTQLWHSGNNGYNNAYSYISARDAKAYLAFTNMGDDEGEVAVNRVIDAFADGVLNLADDAAPCSSFMPAITSHIPQFTGYTDAHGDLTYESIDTRTISSEISTPVGLPLAAYTASRKRSYEVSSTVSATMVPGAVATVEASTSGASEVVQGCALLAVCFVFILVVIA